jgi:hypothetical protein
MHDHFSAAEKQRTEQQAEEGSANTSGNGKARLREMQQVR